MRRILVLLTTFTLNFSFCQSISSRILDEETLEPLEYVNIRVANKNIGVVSNKEGEFNLDISGVGKDDTIRFSYIGYEPLSLTIEFLNSSKQEFLKLKPRINQLNEVVISAKSETHILGNQKVGRGYTGWGDFQSLRGRIRGLLIDGAECPVKVKSMSFRINHNEWDSVTFRINFLEVKDGKPDNSVLTQNIFVTTAKKHKWIKVELNDLNVVICERSIVTVEWIDAWGSIGEFSNLLTISLGKNKGYSYSQELGEQIGVLSVDQNSPAIIIEVYGI
jgi:CarboxypepD_reg-like domain